MKRLFKTLPSGNVSYLETTGTGPTLLFVHGNSSCADAFHHQLEHLGSSYRCLALDFLGHGESSPANNAGAYSFAGCSEQIIEFIDELQLENVIVVGHSLGGHAIIDALPRLEGIAGVLLVGAPPFNADSAGDAFLPDPSEGLIFAAELDGDELTKVAKAFANEDKLELSDWIRVVKSVDNTHSSARPGILAGFSEGELQDEVNILQQSGVCAMSIVGEQDGFINNDYFNSEPLKAIFGDNAFFIDDCHHCPHLEAPEVFNGYLEGFIKQCFPKKITRSQVLNEHKDGDIFIDRYMPLAEPGVGEVMIEVKATSVNPFDYKISRGELPHLAPEHPAVLHSDVAGVVIRVGEQVSEFKPGDKVFGCAGGVKGRQGALTDVMLADQQLLGLMPKNLSFKQAAALPMGAITAWEGLEAAGLQAGMKVLVHGGTGGVGHMAVQLAKHMGAEVYATVGSVEKGKLALKMGADGIIHYHTEDVEEYVSRITGGCGFDLVFDTVGNENIPVAMQACTVGGHVVTTLANNKVDLKIASGRRLNLHFINMLWPMLSGRETEAHGKILKQLTPLVEAGKLTPLLDSQSFLFEQAGLAHEFAASGEAVGKVTLVNG
ncbi:alpha/beta fold hydrolase [Thalassomonas sp. RHCl1]|uniref:alpha/beta fold hydrolase n=1 Tax=Thalassomonas sp. RHCl1 TaxID=2995320 RepID=UPI00248C1AD5|nr:alpha/beta fold hydrolase [Thalassomonas sp. RHCl1]